MSFDWVGKNSEGVPQWVGDGDRPPLWIVYGWLAGSAFFCLGTGWLFFLQLTGELQLQGWPLLALLVGGPLDALFFGGVGLWKLSVRRQVERLVPQTDLAARLGLDPAQVEELIHDKGIRPRLGVNLRGYYALEDFDPALILLRGSSLSPAGTDSLLRVPADAASSPQDLMRPIERSAD